MHPALSPHEPLLINTIGHSAGALLFGLSLYFLLRHSSSGWLNIAAAALAFVYNLSSLVVLVRPGSVLVAVSISALSILPALLLHVALGARRRWIVGCGYAIAAVAVTLHAVESLGGLSHGAVLLITTGGFGLLTAATFAGLLKTRESASRLVSTMALFLFSMSLMHFTAGEPHGQWPLELFLHHAGVLLALLILLQDYRFLLLDAYVRVLASLALAGLFVLVLEHARPGAAADPFQRGLYLVGGAAALVLYGEIRAGLQNTLTRVLFGRPSMRQSLDRLQAIAAQAPNESAYLRLAAAELARFVNAGPGSAYTVQVRFGAGDSHEIPLGPRRGGRRYLSEDIQALDRLAARIASDVEHFRQAEMSRLVAQAELRALESQIQPHFLFNALNTLYGVIPRDSPQARRMVLNLSDVLRYLLKADRTYIALEEELRVVEAYLDIERLRLGSRLRTEIQVQPDVRLAPIPVLSLQPLVENAVKYAIAPDPSGGAVYVEAARDGDHVRISVRDTGPGFGAGSAEHGQGVGLKNVERRLRLCYGPEAKLVIDSTPSGSRVSFAVPAGVPA